MMMIMPLIGIAAPLFKGGRRSPGRIGRPKV
ncbi:hypothetical protein M527_26325 [Sphingobium indicum IP26]|nr:hypothetical protein M527_26325 [Sphingobium indicum IP26]EQB09325.1 hypothetical protein L286_00720 [Sphingobium sp. HDIP04]